MITVKITFYSVTIIIDSFITGKQIIKNILQHCYQFFLSKKLTDKDKKNVYSRLLNKFQKVNEKFLINLKTNDVIIAPHVRCVIFFHLEISRCLHNEFQELRELRSMLMK